jgi:hypothetical protein
MDIGSRDLDPSNQTKFLIHGIMQLIAEKGFSSFLRPRSIFTSPGFGLIAARSICVLLKAPNINAWMTRVLASSPRGVSALAWPGSDVMKVASCMIPFCTLSFMASSCLCISAHIFWSTPFSARRSLNFQIVVESGTVSVVPRNTLNEMRSAISRSSYSSDRL